MPAQASGLRTLSGRRTAIVSGSTITQFHLDGRVAERQPKRAGDRVLLCICLKHVACEFELVMIEELLVLANRRVDFRFRGQRFPCPTQVGLDLRPKLDEFR
jgi:hypothetical protein